MTTQRGDIVLAIFPDSSRRTGKPRPALVIQANDLSTGLAQTLVAMITSNMSRAGHPSRVSVSLATPEGHKTGLRADSVIMTDNLATIDDRFIDRVIGAWSDMTAVDAALRHTLGI
jgi:mRNA interferase MazF